MPKQVHRQKSPWSDDHNIPWAHYVIRSGEVTGLGFGADLVVRVVPQYRHFYPPGNKPGCCTERRTILRVDGPITSIRDVLLVEAKLSQLAQHVVPATRTTGSKHKPAKKARRGGRNG